MDPVETNITNNTETPEGNNNPYSSETTEILNERMKEASVKDDDVGVGNIFYLDRPKDIRDGLLGGVG
jgi:hypothetical protein